MHRYRVGTEIPRLVATSRRGTPLASRFSADLIRSRSSSVFAFSSTFTAELASDFEAGASSFDGYCDYAQGRETRTMVPELRRLLISIFP